MKTIEIVMDFSFSVRANRAPYYSIFATRKHLMVGCTRGTWRKWFRSDYTITTIPHIVHIRCMCEQIAYELGVI